LLVAVARRASTATRDAKAQPLTALDEPYELSSALRPAP
jgi:hypothetical protein